MNHEGRCHSDQLMISCDWGTSSFRLKLVETESGSIISEFFSNDGMAKLYHRWQSGCQQWVMDKSEYYIDLLYQHACRLTEGISVPLRDIPIIISGMACSSIGIKELPYAAIPLDIDGANTIQGSLNDHKYDLKITLISGASNGRDVMRGEETQLIGLYEFEPGMHLSDNFICIFPGTHSKHMSIALGKVVDFNTFMTGELFDLLIHHSILKDSVCRSDIPNTYSKAEKEAFCNGVRDSEKSNLLHTLFSVRINRLFEYVNKNENYFYLSGLLIGSELRSLIAEANAGIPIFVCSGKNVYELYHEAISELGMSDQTTFISPELMDKAITQGHIKLMNVSKNSK